MERSYHFSIKKFSSLTPRQQHKKCLEILKHIINGNPELVGHYNELAAYLCYRPLSNNKKELLDRLQEHHTHSGTFRKEYDFFVATQDKIEGASPLDITIYLDNLRSSHNIGSIIRTCEAFRLGSCVFSDRMVLADHPSIQKSAMGAQEWVACQKMPIEECPRPIIALETVASAPAYYDFTFPDLFTLAVGNEEYGLSDKVLQLADFIIQIPLFGRKNSLNVGCAFAILAAEITKQKRN